MIYCLRQRNSNRPRQPHQPRQLILVNLKLTHQPPCQPARQPCQPVRQPTCQPHQPACQPLLASSTHYTPISLTRLPNF